MRSSHQHFTYRPKSSNMYFLVEFTREIRARDIETIDAWDAGENVLCDLWERKRKENILSVFWAPCSNGGKVNFWAWLSCCVHLLFYKVSLKKSSTHASLGCFFLGATFWALLSRRETLWKYSPKLAYVAIFFLFN